MRLSDDEIEQYVEEVAAGERPRDRDIDDYLDGQDIDAGPADATDREATNAYHRELNAKQEAEQAKRTITIVGRALEAGDDSETDVGNARRFVNDHGRSALYCYPWKAWVVWDGRRWKRDESGAAVRLAKKTVGRIFKEAGELHAKAVSDGSGDVAKEAEALMEWAKQSCHRTRIEAMLALARPELPVSPSDLDADPMLLNCPNGTLDLRTGELRSHDRADRITRLCPTEYRPGAPAPRWRESLDEIFGGEDELVAWMKRLFGYCLTGDVSEQVLPVFHGGGGNGKSTLLEAVVGVVGRDYAGAAARVC